MNRENEMEQEYSEGKGIVIVPLKLLEKIDLNRDNLSRGEFIELCINTLVEQGDSEGAANEPASRTRIPQRGRPDNNIVNRKEFEEFKENVRGLLRSYVEYLPDQMVEPLTTATSEAQERFRRLEELLKGLEH